MSQDPPVVPRQESRSDAMAVVEWGAETPDRAVRPRWSLAAVLHDHRLPAVLAGLGGVAAVASLLGEWLVMTVPNQGPTGESTVRIPGGVSEVGGFGVGYLVGLLGLAGAVTLALRGTPAVRQNTRLLGLALVGVMLAMLAATAFSLTESTERLPYYSVDDGLEVEYGRGLVMAFVATALAGLALQRAEVPAGRVAALAGPADPTGPSDRSDDPSPSPDAPPGRDADASATPGGAAGRSAPGGQRGRGWRRRGGAGRLSDDDGPPPPADLTVEPAAPFIRPEPPNRP